MTNDRISPGFGPWLAAARRRAGYTQEQASERAGVNRVTWARWETGAKLPGRAAIPAMAEAVRAPVDQAYAAAGLDQPDTAPAQAQQEIADRLRGCRESLRLAPEDVADALGIARSTYAHYEAARVSIPAEALRPLCLRLGVTSDWLLGMPDADDVLPPLPLDDERR